MEPLNPKLPAGAISGALPLNQSRATARAVNPSLPAQIELLADEHGMFVKLPLTRGLYTLVDFEDLERVNAAGKWSATRNGCIWYAKNGQAGYLHRLVVGAPSDRQVDYPELQA